LLTGGFPDDECVVVVEIVVFDVPDIAVIAEVGLAASVGGLVLERWLGGQPVEQALPAPVGGRFGGVLVRSLWPTTAHILSFYVTDT
jgi:hypothetical protein